MRTPPWAREIIRSIPMLDSDVLDLSPSVHAVKVALNEILHEFPGVDS